MKEARKAARIPNDIFNENTTINYERGHESSQNSQWNIQWKCTALIMKEVMNRPNLVNEIFIEIAHG